MRFVFFGLAIALGVIAFCSVGYGVMVGFGGGIGQAEQSNRILSWAVPVALGLAALAALFLWLGTRID